MKKYGFKILFLAVLLGCNHPESKDFERYKKPVGAISENIIPNSKIEKDEQVVSATDSKKRESQSYYKVVAIKDGDTFVILSNGMEQTVRFAHIDCPEKKQPFGVKAKIFVSNACFGKYVSLIINPKNKYDRNKRLIAEVILENGKNLNKELMKNGLAWHFKKYSDNQEYANLERNAKKQKIGIWSEVNPIAPWGWRKMRKSSIIMK